MHGAHVYLNGVGVHLHYLPSQLLTQALVYLDGAHPISAAYAGSCLEPPPEPERFEIDCSQFLGWYIKV